MLTGLHTHQNGQYGLAHAVHNQHTFDWVETLPALLRKAGVRTGIVGKKHVKPDALYPFDVEVAGPPLAGNRNVAAMAAAAGEFLRGSAGRPFFLVMGYSDPHREFQGRKGFPGVPAIPAVDPARVPVPRFLPDLPEVRATSPTTTSRSRVSTRAWASCSRSCGRRGARGRPSSST